MKTYRLTSRIDPRIEIRASSIHGKGIFAQAPVKQGEIIIVWGGFVFSKRDIETGIACKDGCTTIDKDLFLGYAIDEGVQPDASDFMNHACDPNVWMQGDAIQDKFVLIARKDIQANEELTIDYAMFEGDENWVMQRQCQCGSEWCRKRITGKYWELQELCQRYGNHFSPFILRRIRMRVNVC